MKGWAMIAVLLFAGCSGKPEPQQVEVIIKTDKPEMTAEQKAAEAELKAYNDLQGPAVKAYGRFVEEGGKRKDDVGINHGFALAALEKEVKVIEQRDGKLAAARIFHDELVGKTLDEFVAKWAPRYKFD